jgi:hypothetical protein
MMHCQIVKNLHFQIEKYFLAFITRLRLGCRNTKIHSSRRPVEKGKSISHLDPNSFEAGLILLG